MIKYFYFIWSPSKDFKKIIHSNSKNDIFNRLYPLKKFTSFATLILLIWSGLSESLFLLSGFYGISQKLWVSFIPIFLIVILMESGKYFLGSYTIRFIIHRWLKLGWHYTLGFIIILPITIALYFGSIYMSINGAPMITSFISHQTQEPHVANIDSIQQIYNQRLLPIYDKIDKAQNTTWQGITTKHGSELASQFQEQVIAIEQQRESAIKVALLNAETQNQNLVLKSTNWAIWLARFGGYGEGLTILFLAFIESFNRASFIESQNNVNLPNKNGRGSLMRPSNVLFEGKSYTPKAFKAWIKKTERRIQSAKTDKGKSQSSQRHQQLLEVWNNYKQQSLNSITHKNNHHV